jgi:hypothetical protein
LKTSLQQARAVMPQSLALPFCVDVLPAATPPPIDIANCAAFTKLCDKVKLKNQSSRPVMLQACLSFSPFLLIRKLEFSRVLTLWRLLQANTFGPGPSCHSALQQQPKNPAQIVQAQSQQLQPQYQQPQTSRAASIPSAPRQIIAPERQQPPSYNRPPAAQDTVSVMNHNLNFSHSPAGPNHFSRHFRSR